MNITIKENDVPAVPYGRAKYQELAALVSTWAPNVWYSLSGLTRDECVNLQQTFRNSTGLVARAIRNRGLVAETRRHLNGSGVLYVRLRSPAAPVAIQVKLLSPTAE